MNFVIIAPQNILFPWEFLPSKKVYSEFIKFKTIIINPPFHRQWKINKFKLLKRIKKFLAAKPVKRWNKDWKSGVDETCDKILICSAQILIRNSQNVSNFITKDIFCCFNSNSTTINILQISFFSQIRLRILTTYAEWASENSIIIKADKTQQCVTIIIFEYFISSRAIL